MNERKKIQILTPELCNQIAAGEVVERPASVVKELCENSLDAMATEIKVSIENGGQSLIRVEDNGFGIAKEELELAVTRHATSKIQDIQGLSQISSYGFRGEALPSIASVSRFRVASKTAQEEDGTEINVHFGKLMATMPSSLRQGTIIEVEDLFFNIPARLKFLKTASTELKRATDLFVRLALIAEGVSMSLYAGTRLVQSFDKHEKLLARLAKIWTPTIIESLLPVQYASHGIKVHGYASSPRSLQPRGDRILFYVNGRAVSDKLLIKAVRQAYQGKITTRDYPQCVLCIEIDAADVDVNVHPAKSEVRFRDEKLLFSSVMRAIGQALEQDTQAFHVKNLQEKQENSSNGAVQYSMYSEQSLGDLYQPKEQGFWGNADKETRLNFMDSKQEHCEGEWQVYENENALKESLVQNSLRHSLGQNSLRQNSPEDYEERFYPEENTDTKSRNLDLESIYRGQNRSTSLQEPAVGLVPFRGESAEQVKQAPLSFRNSDYVAFEQKYIEDADFNPINQKNTDFEEGKAEKNCFEQGNREQESFEQKNFEPRDFEQKEKKLQGETIIQNRQAETISQNRSLSAPQLPAGLSYLGQICETYLLIKKETSGLLLLDQHAAHERILYERLRKGQISCQNLLMPIEFSLHAVEQERLVELLPELSRLSFGVRLEASLCIVERIPQNIERHEAIQYLKNILADKNNDIERMWIQHACKTALKAGTNLESSAALKLIVEWLACEEPDYCPHGRPCVLYFAENDLERMFKRKA